MTEYLPTEKGVPIRYPSTALFPISSADRFDNIDAQRNVPGDSPFDFLISRKHSLLNGFFSRIAITEINFPWNFPNINYYLNTANIIFDVSGTGGNTHTELNYDLSLVGAGGALYATCPELASIMEQTLNADPSIGNGNGFTWSVSFEVNLDPITSGGFYISCTGGVFKMRADPSIDKNIRQLYDMMGFRAYSLTDDTTPAPNTEEWFGSHRSGRYPSMLPRKYIDIVSENLTYNQDLKDSSSAKVYRDTMLRLYLTPEPGVLPYTWGPAENSQNPAGYDLSGSEAWNWGARPFIIQRQFSLPKQIKWNAQQPIGQVRVQVYDDSSKVLPEQPLVSDDDWYMTLQVSEV